MEYEQRARYADEHIDALLKHTSALIRETDDSRQEHAKAALQALEHMSLSRKIRNMTRNSLLEEHKKHVELSKSLRAQVAQVRQKIEELTVQLSEAKALDQERQKCDELHEQLAAMPTQEEIERQIAEAQDVIATEEAQKAHVEFCMRGSTRHAGMVALSTNLLHADLELFNIDFDMERYQRNASRVDNLECSDPHIYVEDSVCEMAARPVYSPDTSAPSEALMQDEDEEEEETLVVSRSASSATSRDETTAADEESARVAATEAAASPAASSEQIVTKDATGQAENDVDDEAEEAKEPPMKKRRTQ
ncbi:MAG: hypothetical protein MHM6MM_001225 [Cercozoa sp. M6MM]